MNILTPRNGTKRRTYSVYRKPAAALDPIPVVMGLLTIEEAEAQLRIQTVDFIDGWLADHQLMTWAQDHSFRVRPMPGAGHGLIVEDQCNSRPCPWFGDNGDYIGPRDGVREVFRAYLLMAD